MADYAFQIGSGGEKHERLVVVSSGVVISADTDEAAIRGAEYLAATFKREPDAERACLLRNGSVIWSKLLRT